MTTLVKNNKGFSLAQVMVGLAITGALSLMVMKQLSTSQQGQANFQDKHAIDSFMNQISRQFASKEVCDINFAGRPVQQVVQTLKSNRPGQEPDTYAPIVQQGESYASNSFKVESMVISNASSGEDTKANLTITFRKLRKKENTNNLIKKSIVFPAEISGGMIQSCYFDFNIISDDFMNEVAQNICKGPGRTIDSSNNCQFKSFDQANLGGLNCPPGHALADLTYNPSTYLYDYSCSPVLTYDESSCPQGRVKSITPTGEVVCLNAATLIDPSTSTISDGSECSLQVSAGKLKLNCAAGPPPSYNVWTCTSSGWSQGASCASEGMLCGANATVKPSDSVNSLCCGSKPSPICSGGGTTGSNGSTGSTGSGSKTYPYICATLYRCHLGKESKTNCYLQEDGSINLQTSMTGQSCSGETPYNDKSKCKEISSCN